MRPDTSRPTAKPFRDSIGLLQRLALRLEIKALRGLSSSVIEPLGRSPKGNPLAGIVLAFFDGDRNRIPKLTLCARGYDKSSTTTNDPLRASELDTLLCPHKTLQNQRKRPNAEVSPSGKCLLLGAKPEYRRRNQLLAGHTDM